MFNIEIGLNSATSELVLKISTPQSMWSTKIDQNPNVMPYLGGELTINSVKSMVAFLNDMIEKYEIKPSKIEQK